MIHRPLPEEPTLVFVDCPLCSEQARLDLEAGALDCPVCFVLLALADEPVIQELARAA